MHDLAIVLAAAIAIAAATAVYTVHLVYSYLRGMRMTRRRDLPQWSDTGWAWPNHPTRPPRHRDGYRVTMEGPYNTTVPKVERL